MRESGSLFPEETPRAQGEKPVGLDGDRGAVPLAPSNRWSKYAYPAPPGTGPEGKRCRDCVHAYAVRYNRNYWKCDLIKATRGYGTDIRLKTPACRRFEEK